MQENTILVNMCYIEKFIAQNCMSYKVNILLTTCSFGYTVTTSTPNEFCSHWSLSYTFSTAAVSSKSGCV